MLDDRLSADWNQRTTDIKVGTTDSVAMYNSDLLVCHRHLARQFAVSQGIEVGDETDGFQITRHNINNEHWQAIYGQIPVLKRALLPNTPVTSVSPLPFGKTIEHENKTADNMWQVFRNMIPNTKAVFRMVEQRFEGYEVGEWRFNNGTATARIVRSK